ncbi:hypothetical protein D9V32_15575 [Mycetocola tolaasinivorans]|uniref:Uncharacterized protein n=1 Tax=Mycetocola tolaasinivorans TaxID=76635 RepID=A0A3L6ZYT0_9MICO|nr:hypothetical protein [Mycetocola tolaasinivorans]RLP72312.1 hypothetical protein D9V32_15575 [Mycetocola tolaasinivorans]
MTALDVESVTLAPVWFTPATPLVIEGRLPTWAVSSRVQVDRVRVTARWEAPSKYRAGGWVVDSWFGRASGIRSQPYDTIHPEMRDADTKAVIAALEAEHTPAGRPAITLEGGE